MTDGQMTGKQIAVEIAKRADVKIEELPIKTAHVWVSKFTAMDVQTKLALKNASPEWAGFSNERKGEELNALMADMTPMVLQRRGSWPMTDGVLIFEMFEDEDELRVYAMPTKTKDGKPANAMVRYRINKACSLPVYGAEMMPLETWMNLIAEEWQALDADINVAEVAVEVERDAVLAYLRSVPADYLVKDAADDIEEELHLVEVDETDESEPADGGADGDDAGDGEPPAAAAETSPNGTGSTVVEAAAPAAS